MKFAVYALVGLMLVAGPAAAADQATELKTETQKLSYALGLDLGDMQKLQMQKIEELTLYIIEMNKRIETLEKENKKLKNN